MSLPPTRDDDLMLLDVLDRFFRLGQPASEIGRAHGKSRSAILGLIHRYRQEPEHPSTATKMGNRDGDLGPRWWANWKRKKK